jgi:hypothetical protein
MWKPEDEADQGQSPLDQGSLQGKKRNPNLRGVGLWLDKITSIVRPLEKLSNINCEFLKNLLVTKGKFIKRVEPDFHYAR